MVEILSDSLTLIETPIPLKIARLFLASDILHNTASGVRNASRYRRCVPPGWALRWGLAGWGAVRAGCGPKAPRSCLAGAASPGFPIPPSCSCSRLEEALPDVFEGLQEAYRSAEGRMAQELLRRYVLKVRARVCTACCAATCWLLLSVCCLVYAACCMSLAACCVLKVCARVCVCCTRNGASEGSSRRAHARALVWKTTSSFIC